MISVLWKPKSKIYLPILKKKKKMIYCTPRYTMIPVLMYNA